VLREGLSDLVEKRRRQSHGQKNRWRLLIPSFSELP
jgi:hypothetical protein